MHSTEGPSSWLCVSGVAYHAHSPQRVSEEMDVAAMEHWPVKQKRD